MKTDIRLAKKNVSKIILPLIAVLAIGVAIYFYTKVQSLQKNPQAIDQQEVLDLITKVSKLTILPVGESPTIATVEDTDALKDQPFFASAQKGDKVLIYAQAKKAILYSVSLNKIIDIAPLSIGNNTKTTAQVTPTTTDTKAPVKKQ